MQTADVTVWLEINNTTQNVQILHIQSEMSSNLVSIICKLI